jgi:hypothetical protein
VPHLTDARGERRVSPALFYCTSTIVEPLPGTKRVQLTRRNRVAVTTSIGSLLFQQFGIDTRILSVGQVSLGQETNALSAVSVPKKFEFLFCEDYSFPPGDEITALRQPMPICLAAIR